MAQIQVPAGFTLDELLSFLQQRGPGEADGYRTSREWADYFGISEARIGKILIQAKARGLLKHTRAYRQRIDGIMTPVSVYQLTIDSHSNPAGPGQGGDGPGR